ncbi:MAG: precorrin-6y C5,15-methyltransferase (decarboxylating) subunit CbiE [Acidimicrobiales bacterium]
MPSIKSAHNAGTETWSRRPYESYDVIIVGSLSDDLSDCSAETRSVLEQASSVFVPGARIDQLRSSNSIPTSCTIVELPRDLRSIWELLDARPGIKVVLASGDPGYFGIVRLLRELRPQANMLTLPGASSIARAFGRIGRPWDDATVLSAHGRSPNEVADALGRLYHRQRFESSGSFAVLASPEHTPQRIVADIVNARIRIDRLIIASDLDTEREEVIETDPKTAVQSSYSPLSVVLGTWGDDHPRRAITPGRPSPPILELSAFDDSAFTLPDSNYTKPPVRAAIVGRLQIDTLPYGAEVCDIGAGYGTVGTTLLALRPDLNVTFIEKDSRKIPVIEANLARFHRDAIVLNTDAIRFLENLTTRFDALFLGGGGATVLRNAVARAGTSTRLCATFASIERAQLAHELLGNVEIISERRLRRFQGGSRIMETNSTFVAWNEL